MKLVEVNLLKNRVPKEQQKWVPWMFRLTLFVGVLMGTSFVTSSGLAKVKKSTVSKMGAQLGTDFKFDPLSVHGRYETAFQGFATVEDEKLLNKIIDYRTDLKNRLDESKYLR